MNECPDEKLCEKLGRHIHGRIYELYTTNPKYKKIIDSDGVGILEKAKNLVSSTFNHIRHGLQLVSDTVQQSRLEECNKCSELINGSCRLCGCDVSIKTKWASESCPANKWEASPQAQNNKGCGCG